MRRVSLLATILGLGAAVIGVLPASAGQLIAGCFGVDHPPFTVRNPPPGNSVLTYAGSLNNVPPGADAELTVDGPDGTLTAPGLSTTSQGSRF